MRILVVEDDAVTARLLRHHLEKWGHDVVEASDGAQAWARFQAEPFALVLSDWVMPVMDGLELVRNIRASGDGGDRVYAVILTAKNEKRDLVEGMDAGADDFLTKPFDPDELRVRIRAGVRTVELQRKLDARNEDLKRAVTELESANRQMKQDLEAAARIQQTLLPTQLPRVPGFRFAWLSKPCEELAGDTLNVIPLDDEHVALYVLDVTGHGVQAALLSVTVSRVMAPQGSLSVLTDPLPGGGRRAVAPAEVAARLNDRFPWDVKTLQFFTLIYGILHLPSRRFRYISAGHPGPLLLPASGDPIIPRTQSYPIGLSDKPYIENELELAPGDRLYLYSDGAVEALNDQRKQFGTERFTSTLLQARASSLEDSFATLLGQLAAWQSPHQPTDDISLLALEVLP